MFASAGLKTLLGAFKKHDVCDVKICLVCESEGGDGNIWWNGHIKQNGDIE
jgi:hypothetical protein